MNTVLEIHGHRGCRGHYPENTINGFLKAIELGAEVIEMDVVISKDDIVIVSHEAYMNHEIALDPNGNQITKEQELAHNLYQMTYAQIRNYDVGSMSHPRYPEQQQFKEYKPSLVAVINTIETFHPGKIKYNIEIKRKPKHDQVYHPHYEHFTDLVANVLIDHKLLDRANLQSFDIPVLQYLKKTYPEIKVALLIEGISSIRKNIKKLGYKPEIYSPHYRLLNKEILDYCNTYQIQLIPWTVNNYRDIRRCIKMGVDGIISDYPDRVAKVWKDLNHKNAR